MKLFIRSFLIIFVMLGVGLPAVLRAQAGVPVKIWATATAVTPAFGENAVLGFTATFSPSLPTNSDAAYSGSGFRTTAGAFSIAQKTVQMEPGKTYNFYGGGSFIS